MEDIILFVDDEEGICKVMSMVLADIGYKVITAHNGEDALKIFKKVKPFIVISDIKMPGMDGIELLKHIKNECRETEVIIISGHADINIAIKSLKYEAADFILKPIDGEALEIALKRAKEKIENRKKLKEYTERLEELVEEKSAQIIENERIAAQKYQKLFDEVPCYISVQNKNFVITASNRRFKEDFGEGIGSPCYQVYKHRTEPCIDCPLLKTFEDGNAYQSETVVTSKTFEQYNVLTWTAPIYDNNGKISQVMEMSTNITQIRKLQDHLSSLGMLIGSISHSIKGLLTGLDGGMYLLNAGFVEDDKTQISEGWEIVKLTIGRIRKMVLDILYYAKERELKWEKVDALSFANEIAVTVEPKIQNYNIEFIKEFDTSGGIFEIDPGVIHSALINILENAIDACIDDKSKKSHKIFFGLKQEEDHVLFIISDNGIGMDRETKEKLFTLFFSSKGHRGTGLGLFITNKIIEQHGGTIIVESKSFEGSKFIIKLPKWMAT
ncbi:MAG: hybrid sensor histidine kinase/response regulator [Desulfobacterales bacterium]|nr:hybrid sensor histidine kinase/response regulator [Desulfobacterales bacterium]